MNFQFELVNFVLFSLIEFMEYDYKYNFAFYEESYDPC
jgi:hypothetical protein